jgi:hypothetical protein
MIPRPQFPVRDGFMWEPSGALWKLICDFYDTTFVQDECALAAMWLTANPSRMKTARGMPRFLNGWLARASASPVAKPRPNDAWMVDHSAPMAPEVVEEVRARLRAKGVKP